MSKFNVIVRQVIRKNLKSPAYIFSLLLPVILIAAVALFAFINKQTNQTPKMAIVSDNPALRTALVAAPTHGDYKVDKKITTPKDAEKRLAHEKLDGYLTITTKDNTFKAVYRQRTNANSLDTDTLKNNFSTLKIQQTAQQLGLKPEQLQQLFAPAKYQTQNVAYRNGVVHNQKSNQQGANIAIAVAVTFLMYMFLIQYASLIAQETATEKGSHIMEILVSSVSPTTQFFGKITGMFCLIILQVIVALIAAGLGINYLHQNVSFLKGFSLDQIQPGMIGLLVCFFIVGIMLYTVMAAMLGALVTRQEQVGQALSPLTTLGLVAYVVSFIAMNSNSLLIRIGSFVPFLSQSLMPVRYAVGNASTLEAWLAVAVELATLIILAFIAVRVYRNHVLDYSRKHWFSKKEKA